MEVQFISLELLTSDDAIQLGAASSKTSSSSSAHQLRSNAALLMKVFHTTLFSIPSNVIWMHKQFLNAAIRVRSAIDALHAGGYVHCDVKPGNIVLDSHSDNCFLADYDAAVKIHQPVDRTTAAYLPAEFAALHKDKMLLASSAVDYAMLAFTLAERSALPFHQTADETATTAAPSSSASSGRLFFNLHSFRRTLPTLRSSLLAERQRCQALLAIQHTTPPNPVLVTDMQERCELMQQIDNIAQKVEELDSNQLSLGGQLVSAQEAKSASLPSLSSLPPATLSNQSYHVSF